MVRSASRSMTAVAMDCCAERGIVRPLSKARWTVRASRSARWSSPAVARLAVVDVAAAASAAVRRNPSKVARKGIGDRLEVQVLAQQAVLGLSGAETGS
jgi:hypothetical protein